VPPAHRNRLFGPDAIDTIVVGSGQLGLTDYDRGGCGVTEKNSRRQFGRGTKLYVGIEASPARHRLRITILGIDMRNLARAFDVGVDPIYL
jgi:hypothetical protein